MSVETVPKKYTLEEFFDLDLFQDDRLYELIKGEIVEVPLRFAREASLVSKLGYFLSAYLEDDKFGKVFTGAGCVDEQIEGNFFIPDIAFVVNERLVEEDYYLPYPDLAIEVVSRGETWFNVRDKAIEYLKGGTRMVWVVFWPDELIFVYHANQNRPEILQSDDKLDGEDVLPGLKIPISKIFNALV